MSTLALSEAYKNSRELIEGEMLTKKRLKRLIIGVGLTILLDFLWLVAYSGDYLNIDYETIFSIIIAWLNFAVKLILDYKLIEFM